MAPEGLKASDNLLLVRWEHHEVEMLQQFCRYFANNAFVDVTLWCQGRSFKAHRILLSACSEYLERVLLEQPRSSVDPVMVVVHGVELGHLLDLIYRGEVRVSAGELPRFLECARILGVRMLQSTALRICAALADTEADPAEGQLVRSSTTEKQV
ncbi:longitudinals lacking protein-like [Schistocerca serialis cubense]|uniref:longitudinals lacking protein-like n=1 Tax=Schistocerca serialis cubense TaxID=2023355 RepID=UPI00214E4462|nr:longitudinals lacking protein-like [Schistocerca serialis cubense]